jgi:hypothetical protein
MCSLVLIVFLIDGLLISDRRRRLLCLHHRHRRDVRRLLHRDSFRHPPCYDRLCCCWLARGFHFRH